MTGNTTDDRMWRTRAGRTVLTLAVMEQLAPHLKETTEGARQDLKMIAGVPELAKLYETDPISAISELYARKTLRTAHDGDAEALMSMLSNGVRDAQRTMTHIRALNSACPEMPLYADTPCEDGQRALIISHKNDDVSVCVYAYDAERGIFSHPNEADSAVKIGQNSDGTVSITNVQSGDTHIGLVRKVGSAPAPRKAPVDDTPSVGF